MHQNVNSFIPLLIESYLAIGDRYLFLVNIYGWPCFKYSNHKIQNIHFVKNN